jgi:hypothetical protein
MWVCIVVSSYFIPEIVSIIYGHPVWSCMDTRAGLEGGGAVKMILLSSPQPTRYTEWNVPVLRKTTENNQCNRCPGRESNRIQVTNGICSNQVDRCVRSACSIATPSHPPWVSKRSDSAASDHLYHVTSTDTCRNHTHTHTRAHTPEVHHQYGLVPIEDVRWFQEIWFLLKRCYYWTSPSMPTAIETSVFIYSQSWYIDLPDSLWQADYYYFLLLLVGWDWVHLVLRPLLAYCTSPRW